MWLIVRRTMIGAGVALLACANTAPASATPASRLSFSPSLQHADGGQGAVVPVTHRRSWRRAHRHDDGYYDYYPRTRYYDDEPRYRTVIIERSVRTYEPAPVVIVPPPVVVYPPRIVIHPPTTYPRGVYVEEVVRPSSCGVYRYWDGEGCVDARKYPPYVGPRY